MAEDIRDIGRLNPSQLFTREEAHDVYERVCDLVRQRNELQEEVAALQETLAIFAALRDLMYESPRALYHVGQNGHVALPRADAARDQHTALPVGAPAAPHDDPANEDLDATVELPMCDSISDDGNPAHDHGRGPDGLDAGDVSSLKVMSDAASAATPCADDPPDNHVQADTVEAGEDAGAISAPTPPASLLSAEHDSPVSPSVETEAGEGTTSQTSQPAPGDQMDPVETGGRPLAGTLLARILAAIEASPRPRRAWQLEKELGLARRPSSELSELVKRGCLERLREGVYSVPGRADYEGMVSADTNNP